MTLAVCPPGAGAVTTTVDRYDGAAGGYVAVTVNNYLGLPALTPMSSSLTVYNSGTATCSRGSFTGQLLDNGLSPSDGFLPTAFNLSSCMDNVGALDIVSVKLSNAGGNGLISRNGVLPPNPVGVLAFHAGGSLDVTTNVKVCNLKFVGAPVGQWVNPSGTPPTGFNDTGRVVFTNVAMQTPNAGGCSNVFGAVGSGHYSYLSATFQPFQMLTPAAQSGQRVQLRP